MIKTGSSKVGAITSDLYRKILDQVPLVTVDMLCVRDGKFLLGKRINKPLQGKWCFPGGRLLKNELLEKALIRKAKEETGLSVKAPELLAVKEFFSPNSRFGPSTHSVSFIYKVRLGSGVVKLKKDAQHRRFGWFSEVDQKWPEYVREVLLLAGFKYEKVVK